VCPLDRSVSSFLGYTSDVPDAFLLIYSAVAGRVERSWISGPIVFAGLGFILGPDGLGVLSINIGGEGLRILAELTLAMVLFTDAANADFGVVRRNLVERFQIIGMLY
jgi:NhaP-type Na+/H+ or K+/H+ antiporter